MSDDIKKQHLSTNERANWNKNIVDLVNHIGAGGIGNHPLGNGTVPGFSNNDYTTTEKNKLAGVAAGATNYVHPPTHPVSMITGLAAVATTGSYTSLIDKPTSISANGGNADTVGGIRLTIGGSAPSNPVINKELWINTNDNVQYIYKSTGWQGTTGLWV